MEPPLHNYECNNQKRATTIFAEDPPTLSNTRCNKDTCDSEPCQQSRFNMNKDQLRYF